MATLDFHLPPKTPHAATTNPVPSSSPAFATPAHPIRPLPQLQANENGATIDGQTIRSVPQHAVDLPPATLRLIAVRTLKKHNLNLGLEGLKVLAKFVGRHCGKGWREEGTGERVLEEVARAWKGLETNPIVDDGEGLKLILKQIEGSMSGGRIVGTRKGPLSRQNSLKRVDSGPGTLHKQDSFGMSNLQVADDNDDDSGEKDPRAWLKVVGAFEQPRLTYNASRKHFEKSKFQASFFPPPSHRTELFRQRYHLIHQRVLRNESFQTPSIASSNHQQWKITPIANLLGRSGTGHLLLGLLTITPTGTLAISDLTGSIHLTLEQATSIDPVETWLCPGMVVLVDGMYEEEYNPAGGSLGGVGGVGGTLGGRFIGFSIGAPRCETRAMTLGISDSHNVHDLNIGGGHGWVDFLGLGSERAVGPRMRKIEQRLLSNQTAHTRANSTKVVVIGDCNLDNPQTLSALRQILASYSSSSSAGSTTTTSTPPPSEPSIPLAFVLLGNFTTHASMSSTSTSSYANSSSTTTSTSAGIPDSITYKESFDALALLLSDFPTLLRHSTWVFVPGDNDPWASAFSAGAAVPLPRQGVPEMFTSRLKRAFASANADAGGPASLGKQHGERVKGEAIWTSNPSRLSLFGPSCEMVLFRDDVSGRMRRNAIPLKRQQADDDENGGNEGDQKRNRTNVDSSTTVSPPPPVDVTMSGALPVDDDDNVNESNVDGADASSAEHADNPISQAEPNTMETDDDKPNTSIREDQPQSEEPQTSHPAPQNQSSTKAFQSLAKTLLDQSTLSPFPLHTRPLHWDYAPSALSLYPLPSALVLCDAEMDAFALTYQGCAVLNAGTVVSRRAAAAAGGKGVGARWVEFDVRLRKGCVREI